MAVPEIKGRDCMIYDEKQQVIAEELEHSSIFFEEQHPSFLLSEEQLAFSEEAHDDCFFVSELQVALFAVELLFSFSLEQHDFLESEDEHDSFFRYLFYLLKLKPFATFLSFSLTTNSFLFSLDFSVANFAATIWALDDIVTKNISAIVKIIDFFILYDFFDEKQIY